MVRATLRAFPFLVAVGMVGIAFGQDEDRAASRSDTVPESCPSVVHFTLGRPPVPDEAAEKQARDVAWQLYGADYTAAKTAASKSALAERLLGESDDAKGDPASRYAMLRIVIDMAGASGNAETALGAADRLIDEFDVKILQEKLALLRALAVSARQMEQRLALAKAAFALLDVAAMEEDFETAQEILALGRTAALKARRADLAKAFEVRQPRIESIGKAYQEFLAAKKGLDSTPADPANNLAAGRYLCFARGDWNSGIPHLAKCGDAVLKALAQNELAASGDGETAIALGDGWWEAAEGREPWEQDAVRHRAADWYGQVPAEQRTGLTRLQIEKRLGQMVTIPRPSDAGAASGVPVSGRVTLRLRRSWKGHDARVFFTEFSPDGRLLATGGGSEDRLIRFWDVVSGQLVRAFTGYTSWTPRAAFSPDGTLFASAGGWEKTVRIAQVSPGEQLRTLEGHTARVRSVAFIDNGRRLLSCGDDRTVRLWDPHTGELLKTLTPHTAMVTNLVLSSDGSKMATCSPDRTIKIWDVAGLRMQKTLRGDGKWPWKVAFSPDGRFLATTFAQGKAFLWDVESGERRWVTSRTEGEPSQAVAFSPDGRWILIAGQATYYIFDSMQGRELARFQAHPDVARCARFSPDGRTLATSGDDGLIKLWDVETWSPE